MLVPKKISKTKSALMVIFILVIFAGIGYLIYSRFFQTEEVANDDSQTSISEIKQFSTINSNFSSDFIFERPYSDLIQNGRLPVQAGQTGRSNPFSEIPFSLLGR